MTEYQPQNTEHGLGQPDEDKIGLMRSGFRMRQLPDDVVFPDPRMALELYC